MPGWAVAAWLLGLAVGACTDPNVNFAVKSDPNVGDARPADSGGGSSDAGRADGSASGDGGKSDGRSDGGKQPDGAAGSDALGGGGGATDGGGLGGGGAAGMALDAALPSNLDLAPAPDTAPASGPDLAPPPPDLAPVPDLAPPPPDLAPIPDLAPPPPDLAPLPGQGLRGEYFSGADLNQLVLTRVDPQIDFNWGPDAPDPRLPYDNFSVRWTGFIEPRYTETYTFYALTDDGVRLWVDGVALIDQWLGQPAAETSVTFSMIAGRRTAIKVEYFDHGFTALARLSWSSRSQAKEIVPASQLWQP